MALIIAPFLFIGAVLYVAYPLLVEGRERIPPEEGAEREQTFLEKEEIVDALKDIEMDFRMGKLSDSDYRSLKRDFERRAVEVFQRLESLERKRVRSRKKKS